MKLVLENATTKSSIGFYETEDEKLRSTQAMKGLLQQNRQKALQSFKVYIPSEKTEQEHDNSCLTGRICFSIFRHRDTFSAAEVPPKGVHTDVTYLGANLRNGQLTAGQKFFGLVNALGVYILIWRYIHFLLKKA